MKNFVITIDVEPDAVYPTWKTSNPISFKGVIEGIPLLDEFAKKKEIKLTYLAQPAVLLNQDCVNVLKCTTFEVGSHLHGDYISPSARYPGPDFSGCDPIEKQKDYTYDIEFGKLETLSKLFRDKIGYFPLSFRAGRFGIGKNSYKILHSLGYTHDTSVVPGWKHFKKEKRRKPFLKDGVIEVPITADNKRKWLRPTIGYSNKKDIKEIIKWAVRKNLNVLCTMFHNVEIIPGASPYCNSNKEKEEILDRLSLMVDLLIKNKYFPSFLREIEI
ncbi:MAG: hypothetical protein WC755_02200 [Candidatus Woesearchaeota archaeon]|jgi:hypothetical protein